MTIQIRMQEIFCKAQAPCVSDVDFRKVPAQQALRSDTAKKVYNKAKRIRKSYPARLPLILAFLLFPVIATAVSNPDGAVVSCAPLDIIIVLDESFSINATEAAQVRAAVESGLDDLQDTGSRVAIVEFSIGGRTGVQFTEVTAATRATFSNYLNNSYTPTAGGNTGTDWTAGFTQAKSESDRFAATSPWPGYDKPDYVVFFTDGFPNEPTGNAATDLNTAVAAANVFKNLGTHIDVLGVATVGSNPRGPTAAELQAISEPGPIPAPEVILADGSNMASGDYNLSTAFSNFNLILQFLFNEGTCTAHDYGDAPASYGEPRHFVAASPSVYLGTMAPDMDSSGQHSVTAALDDGSGVDDDDGVTLDGSDFQNRQLTIGSLITLSITTTGSGFLNAWFDWNADGDFADAGEQVAINTSLGVGTYALNVTVPVTSAAGATYARFRYGANGLSYTGIDNAGGEIEDYRITISSDADYGDAPSSYDSGIPASHTVSAARLGATRDSEGSKGNGFVGTFDGTQDDVANSGSADDEDAFYQIPLLDPSINGTATPYTLVVPLSNVVLQSEVCGWIDLSGDGVFGNVTGSSGAPFNAANPTRERACATVAAGAASATLSWYFTANTPALSASYLRLRIVSGNAVFNAAGSQATGEVEDYPISIGACQFQSNILSNTNLNNTYNTSGENRTTGIQSVFNGWTYGPGANLGLVFSADYSWSNNFNSTTLGFRIDNTTGTLYGQLNTNINPATYTASNGASISPSTVPRTGPTNVKITLPAPNILTSVTAPAFLKANNSSDPITVSNSSLLACQWDNGDAPSGYATARHVAVPGSSRLGTAADYESAFYNNPITDDETGNDDEDALSIFLDFYLGQTDTLTIPVSNIPVSGAKLCGWIDYDGNSAFDTAERVCAAIAPGATTADLTWTIPVGAAVGPTYARLRIVDGSATADFDAATTHTGGEVEDYALNITSGPPTLAAIGDVSVDGISVDTLINELGGDNADLLKLLAIWDPQLAEALQGADLAAILEALRYFLDPDGDGMVALMRWSTLMERGTVGFFAEREDPASGEWLRLNNGKILPGLITASQGGEYLLVDPAVKSGEAQRYRLVEREVWGTERTYGPWKLLVGSLKTAQAAAQQVSKDDAVQKSTKGPWKVMGQGYVARMRHLFEPAPAVTAALQQQHEQSRVVASAAGASGVRLRTGAQGLYRLDAAALAKAAAVLGIGVDNLSRQLSGGRMRLDSGGALAPYHFDAANSSLYFMAKAYQTLETQHNVFRLNPGDGKTIPEETGIRPAAAKPGVFRDRQKFEENNWLVAWTHNEENADYWYWDYIYAPGIPSVSLQIQLPEPTAQGRGEIFVYLRGVSDEARGNDHRASLRLNGAQLPGSVSWNGNAQAVLRAGFDQTKLDKAVNGLVAMNLQIDGKVLAGETYSLFMIDRVEVDYNRKMRAHQGGVWVRNVAAGTHAVDGFTSKAVNVVENPGTAKAKWRKNITFSAGAQGGWQVSFNAPVKADYLIAETLHSPIIEKDAPSALKAAVHSSDYLIIAPRELAQGAAALADYRAHEFGTEIVWLEDIYDEFSFGRTQSAAIEKFLAYAHAHWERVPRYVVLLGRGTLDHRDLLGYHESLIPLRMAATPWGLAPSDNRYADVDGDKLPDFLLGRIAASSEAEAVAYVDKLIAYEAALPDGTWNMRAVLVADNPDAAGNFHVNSSRISKLLQSYNQGYAVSNLYHPLVDVRGNLLSGWRTKGYGYVNYIGHGAATQLAAESFMTVNDVDSAAAPFNNAPRLPVFAALTCAVGDSSEPGVLGLSDKLILHKTGGAIAAFSPAGLSLDEQAFSLNKYFVNSLLGNRASIGEAVEFAHDGTANTHSIAPFMHDIYQISGDSAVKLR